MKGRKKWVIALITLLVIAAISVSDGADARRCRRRPRRCRPRPVQPTPLPPRPHNVLTVNGAGFSIPDEGESTNTVPVDLGGQRVTDVDVELRGLSHDKLGDVDALVVSPGERASILMADAGGAEPASNLALTFDDEASRGIGRYDTVLSGSYRPTSLGAYGNVVPQPPAGLGAFDGLATSGDWTLAIRDDAPGGIGSLSGWTLKIALAPATVQPGDPDPGDPPVIQPPPANTLTVPGEGPATIPDDNAIVLYAYVSQQYASRSIADINVKLNGLTHTAIQDLDFKLWNPADIREVVLLSDVGSGPVDGVSFTLDDDNGVEPPRSGPLVDGQTYLPRNVDTGDAFGSPDVLSEFDGTDPAGRWQLIITDDEINDVGSLDGWELEILFD